MTSNKFLICAFQFLIVYITLIKSDKVDDYIKIINEGIEKAKSYKFPTDNSALYPGNLTDNVVDFGTYDYIVVGAGSAGAIVAKRFSEAKKKTLLIEAGEDETEFSIILGIWKVLPFSELNWGYSTKPQQHICQGMINKQCFYGRGKALGGTSAINGMLHVRGTEFDQPHWTQFGITGWSWEEVLPFYKKLENSERIDGDPDYHGYDGPVPIDYSRPASLMIRHFLNAYDEIGDVTEDYDGKHYMGAGKTHYNKKNGKRGSTNQCYLKDINEHLTILTKAYVYKVIIENKKAIGVEFSKDGIRYKVKSKIEVVLSAGSVNTPQILMLSGIGPRQELDKHKIPVIVDLPVGKHFQDHFAFHIECQANISIPQKTLEMDVWELLSETGRLTTSENFAFAFLSTDPQITDYPDVELVLFAEQTPYHGGLNLAQYNDEVFKTYVNTMSKVTKHAFIITVLLLHPKSEGEITLQSSDPNDFPIIDSLTHFVEEDHNTIYKGVQHVMKLLDTKTFKALDAALTEMIMPACKDHDFGSKAFWMCFIQQTSFAGWHSVGSARMGRKGESVLDSKLKVHGIKSLRVIDLSAVPLPNSGHPHAVAMMLGEKGADIVLKDNSRGSQRMFY